MPNSTRPKGSIPALLESSYSSASIVIGNQKYYADTNGKGSYFALIVDLADKLNVVAKSQFNTNDLVPQEISQYYGKSNYCLLLATLDLKSDNLPHGEFYNFLRGVGSGSKLEKMEQVYEQISCGSHGNVNYSLVATTTTNDPRGFEEMSFFHETLQTVVFIPLEYDGKTIYSPTAV